MHTDIIAVDKKIVSSLNSFKSVSEQIVRARFTTAYINYA